MTTEHGAKRTRAGAPCMHGSLSVRGAVGWGAGGPLAPYAWKAPRAPKTADGLAAVLMAHAEHVADAGTTGAVTDGEWRWDGDTAAPLGSFPRAARDILEGAIARGEHWGVKVTRGGAVVAVSVGRTPDDQAGATFREGKASVATNRLCRPGVGHVHRPSLAQIRAAFPAAGREVAAA